MKDLFRGKFVTILVVVATVILAGVAIFTGIRLYQLRQESISLTQPESEPSAWDCKNYTFNVDSKGVVTVNNSSDRDEPSQQAQVYIDDQLKATLSVPALLKGQKATLGNVEVPKEAFNWKVQGTKDCSNSGKSTPAPIACELLKFSLAQPSLTPIPSLTVTPEPTITPIPTTTSQPGPPGTPVCTATRPDAPTITSVVKNGSSATITWSKVTGVTHYTISYGTQQGNYPYGVPNTGNVTSYTVKDLNPSSTYYFVVYAVNDCMPSLASASVGSVASAGTGGATIPSAGVGTPTLVISTAGILIILLAFLLAF